MPTQMPSRVSAITTESFEPYVSVEKAAQYLDLYRHQRQGVGTRSRHQHFLAHAQLDAGIEAFCRLAQMRSSPFLNAPAAGVADPAACHAA